MRDEPAFDAGWRAVLDAVPALVYVLAPNGSVTFVNRYFCEYTGLTRAALLADSWAQVIHPEDLPNAAASLASGLAARSTFTVRQRIRGGDGSYRYYDALTVPHCDARGRITQWFGVESDVEDLLRTIEALEEAERGQRTVLDSIPIIVWTADPAGQLEWCNSKWSEFTGEPSANVLDWGWRRAHHPLEVERTTAAWLRSIRTGETFEMEVRLRRHDGAFRWMLTRGVPVRDAAGHIVRWYGSTMEIEAQKQLEARSSRAASLLQAALLPEKLPSIPGVELDALYLPAESNALVGGDWYDAVALGNGRILLSCGDVTGHGLAAAAFATRLRQIIAFAGREDADPARILARVNALVIAEDAPLATAAVACFDVAAATITVALAGHPPPVVAVRGAPAYALAPDGLPLGVVPDLAVSTRKIALSDAAVVVLYTDGITEFDRDILGAEAAVARAAARLVADPDFTQPASFVKQAVLKAANPRDDVAILVVRFTASDPGDG